MTLAPANAFVNIEDPNPRANLRRLIFHADRHYTWIRGCDAAGRRLGGFTLRVPTDQLEVLALALRKYNAGELGRMALDAEYDNITTVVTNKGGEP